MTHALWMRLPRLVRVVASVVIVFNLITWFFREESPPETRQEKPDTAAEIVRGLAETRNSNPENEAAGDVVKSLVNAAAHAFQGGRPLAVVTFGGSDQEATAHAASVFSEFFKLVQPLVSGQFSVSPIPLEANDDDDDALARGTSLESEYLLTGFASRAAPGQPLQLTVKLYQVKSRTVVWTETFDAALSEAPATARRVLEAVRPRALPAAAP